MVGLELGWSQYGSLWCLKNPKIQKQNKQDSSTTSSWNVISTLETEETITALNYLQSQLERWRSKIPRPSCTFDSSQSSSGSCSLVHWGLLPVGERRQCSEPWSSAHPEVHCSSLSGFSALGCRCMFSWLSVNSYNWDLSGKVESSEETDLNVGVKFNEAVWPGGGVDLVPVLTVKLPG